MKGYLPGRCEAWGCTQHHKISQVPFALTASPLFSLHFVVVLNIEWLWKCKSPLPTHTRTGLTIHPALGGHLEVAGRRFTSAPEQIVAFSRFSHSLHLDSLGMENDDTAVQYAIGRSDTVAPGTGIDLEFDADVQTMSPEASEYETCYVTSHKGPCRVATYSRDGQLIATGSADASIKILDTERMLAKSAMPIEVLFPPTAAPDSTAVVTSSGLPVGMGLD